MARWQGDARARLEQAALDLYRQRGYEQTTVAEIAAHAGLTERTYFRYFADKREVLFGGSAEFQTLIVGGVAAAPEGVSPLEAVLSGFGALTAYFVEPVHARQRAAVIAANPELQARELSKLFALAAALAGVLRGRGVPELEAGMAAEVGLLVFRAAFLRWMRADRLAWDEAMRGAEQGVRGVVG